MATSGCGIIFSTSQRIDRNSSSLRRSMSLNSKPKPNPTSTNRSPTKSLLGPDMGFSNGHTRTLSDKVRNLHRKKNSNESPITTKQRSNATHAPAARRSPRHLDLLEAASQTEGASMQLADQSWRNNGQHRDVRTGKENRGINVKQMSPSTGDQSYRSIAYNQYLAQAFGLEGESKPRPAAVRRLRAPEAPDARPESEVSAMSADSMEVNFHHMDLTVEPSAKDRRPKIQVTIPGKITKRRSSTHLASQMDRSKSHRESRDTQVSQFSPSSTSRQGNESEVPVRMSVVSPLSIVEMPKPRRPFSAFSLEDMTCDTPRDAPSMEKSNSSDSSDDTGDHDDRSSKYSGRSSMSSLLDETAVKKPFHGRSSSIAFSVMSPTAAGVFDGVPLSRNNSQTLRAFKSTTSLSVDMNKPLPPEPGMEILPLNLPGNSRPASLKPKRKIPSPLTISRTPMYDAASQCSSRMSSLRSKYTPADLDALDDAFTKTSPNTRAGFGCQVEPSLSQVQAELEAHLGTISEEPTLQTNTTASMVHDPLQISRGPNTMMPSRHAPPPPSSLKLSDGSISSRKPSQRKNSTHVAMQMRPGSFGWDGNESEIRRRISAPVMGSTAKANKVLGMSAPMQRERSSDSNWSSSGSPHTTYEDPSSPTMSREDSSTPETDVSSIPDPAFEEVRARLELLSPKNDSHQFNGFLQPDWSGSSSSAWQMQEQTKYATAEAQYPRSSFKSREIANIQTTPGTPAMHLTPRKEVDQSQVETSVRLDAHQEDTNESNIHPLQRRCALENQQPRPRSLASIAMSEIPDMYADLPSPGTTARNTLSAEDVERMISADAAEIVLLRILESLDNLQDLFSTATVSRGFYRTFKRHELPLMKNALYGMSPAAWELREMSPPYPGLMDGADSRHTLDYTPSLYLQHYMRDMYTMIALKSMILIHCESFLRADTITALAGGETERASQIDDAFWRVWTFCQIFGCGSKREDDIVGQMDWLRGGVLAKSQRRIAKAVEIGANVSQTNALHNLPPTFGNGNGAGLSAEDLYDMTEIWTSLGVLVRGFQGKRHEAREFGIFQNSNVTAGDVEQEDAVLEEWTYHLLTLAPPVVLDVTSPTSPTAATFAHARSRGYTKWTPPLVSRATFLKEAVSRVYEENMAQRHSPSSIKSSEDSITDTALSLQPVNDTVAARWRIARHAAEIRAKRSDPGYKALPPSEDRPMSDFPSVLEKLDAPSAPPVSKVPLAHFRSPSDPNRKKSSLSAVIVPTGPQVRDPVDVAVDRLVAMGFEKSKAVKALAETDTGNSIDFARALESLVRDRKRDVTGLMHSEYRGPIGGEATNDSGIEESAIREAVGLGLNIGGTSPNDTYPAEDPATKSDCTDKSVFVTDASKGIRRATALVYATVGAAAIGLGAPLGLEEEFQVAAEEAGKKAPPVLSCVMDVVDREAIEKAAKEEVQRRIASLDILINQRTTPRNIPADDPDEWWKTWTAVHPYPYPPPPPFSSFPTSAMLLPRYLDCCITPYTKRPWPLPLHPRLPPSSLNPATKPSSTSPPSAPTQPAHEQAPTQTKRFSTLFIMAESGEQGVSGSERVSGVGGRDDKVGA